jgi:hypothetical protein
MTTQPKAPRCHFTNCKRPITHTVQRLWGAKIGKTFAIQHCCDQHVPGINLPDERKHEAARFYRVEPMTAVAS